jgi:hypothetical protein
MIRAFVSDRQRPGLSDVAVTSFGRKGVRPAQPMTLPIGRGRALAL